MAFKSFFLEVNGLIKRGEYSQALELINTYSAPLNGVKATLIDSNRNIAQARLSSITENYSIPCGEGIRKSDIPKAACDFCWPTDYFVRHKNMKFLSEKMNSLKGETVCGLASQAKRYESLPKTLSSLSPQFDRVFVYLNDYGRVPPYFSSFHNVYGFTGDMLFGDIGDVGKFAFIKAAQEFYFTCDDDLIYPHDYKDRSLSSLRRLNYRAAVSWHGSILNDKFENYYSSSSRKVYSFGASHPDLHIPLSVVGTGCLSFHVKTLPGLHLGEFRTPNMADIYFSRYCASNSVGLVLVPHAKDEIKEQEECAEDSIYKNSSKSTSSFKDNSKLINSLIAKQQWSPVTPQLKKVCLIGRFSTNAKGGIFKSCRAISNCLSSRGVSVTEICTSQHHSEINLTLDDFDVIVAYLPHPHRPDYGKWLNICLRSKRPVIANLSYDLTTKSVDIMRNAINESKRLNNNLYIMCFSNAINGYLGTILGDQTVKRVIFPKTLLISSESEPLPGYEEREGILFGDFAKLANPDLVGSNYERWIQPLRKCLPFAPLFVLNHYGTDKKKPAYFDSIDYDKDGLENMLLRFRLYVCLTPYATFEMVPIEAAARGVPVLSRFMPQSTSEYLSQSIIQFETPEQLAYNAERIYNSNVVWSNMHLSAKYAAQSASVDLIDHKIISSIESVCFGLA